jgi:hypothetical protein
MGKHRIKIEQSISDPEEKIIKVIKPGNVVEYIRPEKLGISQEELLYENYATLVNTIKNKLEKLHGA